MPKLNPVSYKQLVRVFEADGFRCVRKEGDHMIFTKSGVIRPVVIPKYASVPVFIIKNNLRTAAVRQYTREPGVTLVLLITMALGIGANTGVFSMLNGLLRPLPVRSPEQLVVVAADTKGDETGLRFRFSYSALEDFRHQANSFSDLFAFTPRLGGFSSGTKTTQFMYSAVTGNYFSALGVKPAIGRLLEPGEGENDALRWWWYWDIRSGKDDSGAIQI
jgi:predicted RNA binding protein YcfA (HicA-like mRNA interferase family)